MLVDIRLLPKFAKLSKILWKIWKFWKRISADEIHSGGEGYVTFADLLPALLIDLMRSWKGNL